MSHVLRNLNFPSSSRVYYFVARPTHQFRQHYHHGSGTQYTRDHPTPAASDRLLVTLGTEQAFLDRSQLEEL
jgi:hypothetical protein